VANVTKNEMQIVVFSLGQAKYGGDITRIQEIIKLPEVTSLPGTADYILGIINLRGNIVPIIELNKKLGFSTSERTDETRVIVVELSGKRFGLIVDEVSEVVKVPFEAVNATNSVDYGIQVKYILGLAKLDEHLLILLDMEKIVG
jgi:purine-binding chemotaxis protein CheW